MPNTPLADAAGTLFRKALKTIRLRGPWGTLQRFLFKVKQHSGELPPAKLDREGREFDAAHGTDTVQTSDPGWLGRLTSRNWMYGQAYGPAPISVVRRALEQLPEEFRDAVFIDIGSGKGRIVLVASEFPFRRVIGVEYDRVLHDVAAKNATMFQAGYRIELHCQDATEFRYPTEPLVVFFHHPFDEPVFEVVCQRLEATHREAPRPICVIYFDPICREVFERSAKFELILENTSESVPYAMYRM
jgi:hypothetical protein